MVDQEDGPQYTGKLLGGRRDDHPPLLSIQNVTKKFDDFVAVDNIELDIYQGELFCLLGGSGCGKTTLLRMLAGFETPTSGKILIDGKDVSDVPPYERPTNMMFQNYALFPHMSVAKNIAFGLEQDGLSRKEIKERTNDILRLVELQGYELRRPQQLSGGQRQRVALARALVKEPKILLLDEPLGALDKKLREQTQFELMNIQDKVGVTFIVVTHDQEEAMVLSSRISVMDQGRLVQTGSPTEIYEFPKSRLVANFIGSANIFEGRVVEENGQNVKVKTTIGVFNFKNTPITTGKKDVFIGIRPEKIFISKEPGPVPDTNTVVGTVYDIGYLGNTSRYKIRLTCDVILDVSVPNQNRPQNKTHEFMWEDKVYITWEPSSAMVFYE